MPCRVSYFPLICEGREKVREKAGEECHMENATEFK